MGLMDGLIAFWTARLDEAERTAKAAKEPLSGRWHIDTDGNVQDEDTGGGGSAYIACGPWGGGIADADAAHIAANDPASALADVAADRALIDLYARAKTYRDQVFSSRPEPRSISDEMRAVTQMLALEQVIKVRAARFSAHPDYRQEWAR